jgi:DNA-binding MarR family transcriptional regulator
MASRQDLRTSQRRKEALEAVERAMVRIRRSQTRRALGRFMESETGLRLKVPDMFVVDALDAGADLPEEEATVGAVAERLGIDPSRGSRMVSGAIKAGYVRRVASQKDGRRIRLELTKEGRRLADVARRYRTAFFARLLEDWPDKDCQEFARLITKFTTSHPRVAHSRRA